VVFLIPAAASAQTITSWIDGSGKWETATNWSGGVAPSTNYTAFITNATTKTVTFDFASLVSDAGIHRFASNVTISASLNSINTLSVTNGGLSLRGELNLGTNATLLIINSSSVETYRTLSVGAAGSNNRIIVSNASDLVTGDAVIGGLPGSNNSVLVTASSVWFAQGNFNIRNSAPGIAIEVSGGSEITATNVFIGNSATADSNIVIVTDPYTYWENYGTLSVGGASRGAQFIVSNSAVAASSSVVIGYPVGTGHSAIVTGSNSVWTVYNLMAVGAGGLGDSMSVANGGALFVTNASHTAQVTVNGATLLLEDGTFKSDNLTVTNGGAVQYTQTYEVDNGTITIADGTVQANSNFIVAATANSTAAVAVVGGSLIVTNSSLSIGNDGTITSGTGVGLMTVSNGTVQASTILIGSSAGGHGDLILADGGTVRCPAGTNCLMSINSLGTDLIGGDLEWYNSTLECGVTAAGDYNVSGGQADLGDLFIGYSATGTMTMAGGVANVSSRLIVGNLGSPLSTGAVWINGGQFTVADYTIIGNSGIGQMTISNGIVTAADVTVGNSSNPGTLTLAGGTLTVNGIVLPNPASHFIFSGGWLNTKAITNANGQAATAGNGSTAAMLDLLGGTSTFDKALTISAIATLSGVGTVSGGVINSGLIAPNGGALTFTGGTVTNYGTIVAPAGGTINFNGLVVNNGVIVTNSAVHFNAGFVNNGTFLDAAADSDGDGMNNADEALAGTDPLNGSSVFRVVSIAQEGNDVRVTWSCVGGKRYIVQSSPGGNYGNSFTNLSPTNSASGVGESTTSYLDLGAAANATRYYRIRLVP